MAGDKKAEQRKVIASEGDQAKKLGSDFRANTLQPQLTDLTNRFNTTADTQSQDYANTMGQFKSLMPQFQNFATTGGIPIGEEQAMRARAVSPIRSIYAGANRELDRSKALGGGYAPGTGVLRARMAREQSQAASDASTNAEAALAGMRQQGRQFGLSGMGETGGRMTSLLGTTPGMTSMFGNAMLTSTGNMANQVKADQGINMGLIDANQNAQQLPGKWEGTMGRIGDIFKLGGNIGGTLTGIGDFMKARNIANANKVAQGGWMGF